MLRLMAIKTAAILVRPIEEDGHRTAIERLARFAEEHSGVSSENLLRIAVEPIDLEANAETGEHFFSALLPSAIRHLYVGDLSLYFKTKAEAHGALLLLERAGFQIFREPQNALTIAEEQGIRSLVETVLALEKLYRQGRLQAARKENAKQGGSHGGNPPYGSLLGEGSILESIRRDQSAGLGHTEIASRLNAEMVKPRKGQKWYPAVIANILGVRREAKKRASARLGKTLN